MMGGWRDGWVDGWVSGLLTHLAGLGDTLGGVSTQHTLLSDRGLWALPGTAAVKTLTGFPGQEQHMSLLERREGGRN